MRKLFPLFFGLFFFSVSGQQDSIPFELDVDSFPQFLYGNQQFARFIQINLDYPVEARSKSVQGTVYTSFIVDTMGQVHSIKVLKDIGSGCGEEASRIFRLSAGLWKPALSNGKKVNAKLTLPLKFTCENCGGYHVGLNDPPYYADYYYQRAMEDLNSGWPLTAILYFNKSLSYIPNYKDVLLQRGKARLMAHDATGACADWNAVVETPEIQKLKAENCK